MSYKKNNIQVFEYEKLKYSGSSVFKEHHFNAMVKFNEKNQNKYFTVIHKGVQFNNYVGVMQIGGLTIEVLPKADRAQSPNKKIWQDVLLNMLGVCKLINTDSISETKLKKRHNSILELYFEKFLNEVDYLIKRGLLKRYRKNQSNQLALKGKLLFSKNIQKNTIHKEYFFCQHQVYDKDYLLIQIILKGLLIVDKLASSLLNDKIKCILYYFEGVTPMTITSGHFQKLQLSKKELPYNNALEIAKMLILNYSPNLNSGHNNMLTLLFDMNMLWEEYIYRILNKHKPTNTKISFQNQSLFWKSKTRNKLVRPDIIIEQEIDDNTEVFVLDTKWKIRDNNNPDDSDLKQMFVYNLHWKSSKGLLLFPRINQTDNYGDYSFIPANMSNNQCQLGFIDLLSPQGLKNSQILASEIFAKFKF